ncbi:YdiU family protein [Mariprofundus erugo]|uniref:Protein nucleotidyltransferase YdiU n=1 Tax=Mariprofundus erugo TaxID=2528639 RepID=A0A5R9GWB4_9PROT|nr:YdiU family protein [Mariprofundus erugo]TLS68232.1 YdiU family protein [Mariprofundus erugo]TLS77088.1 YdiU family protein [Mariprofundus erugo]
MQTLRFDNRFTRLLPADAETENDRRQVYRACYSRVQPTAVSAPELIAWAPAVAARLGLSDADCMSDLFVQVFSGNRLLPGMEPHATCYGGHQFGSWAGQLGDGRAINLGELVNDAGEHWMLQLKGAGPTPYSRNADGLAVLRSSIREFLCSEAMHHLGIPTTRALSMVATGEQVMRDMFYDGRPALEPGAVVCRVAPSFLRFGSLQIFAARKDPETLKQLLDFTIRHDFPHLGEPGKACYLQWFAEVCQRTADLIVAWMRVGFVHGVMNTDNMSVLGLTIDYGPYGWLEGFDPDWTPNTTDRQMHRYCFGKQAAMAGWNLARLGEAILPLIGDVGLLQAQLDQYTAYYRSQWQAMMAGKLGLIAFRAPEDDALVDELQRILQLTETDMTIFYRKLADLDDHINPDDCSDTMLMQPLLDAWYAPQQITADIKGQIGSWLRRYIRRLQQDGRSHELRRAAMNRSNPKYVLRNYLAQVAIDRAEAGDYSEIHRLQALLLRPYDEQPECEAYAARRPEWARERAGCSMLSCSS